MPRAIDTIAAEANRLYWDTETSVADIAQQLELSRRALYDTVDPLPTHRSCDVCGSPLVFENRSARNSGTETCPICDSDEIVEAPPAQTVATPVPPDEDMEHAVLVGGAAIAGAAIGAIATLLLVPRR